MSTTASATAPVFVAGADSYTITIPAGVFAAAVKATATAADTATAIPAMSALSLTVYECGGWELAATDRYRLAVASDCDRDSEAVSNVLIPAKALLSFIRSVKVPKRGTVPPVVVVFGTDSVSLTFDSVRVEWSRADLDLGMFPNYRKLMDTLGNPEPSEWSASCWNPSFMADGAEACRVMAAGKATPVRFECPNPTKPAKFSPTEVVGGLSFTYLLMPVRLH